MFDILQRLHTSIRARLLTYFRTKEIVRVFEVAHAQELRETPISAWPQVKSRQVQELQAVRAGKLDIVDRRSWAWPFIPATVNRLATPLMKATPYNLRRMARTPVPRRAINLIKNAVISQEWDIQPVDGVMRPSSEEEQEQRIKVAKALFMRPNNEDSFQTWLEQGMEDLLILGSFSTEIRLTPSPVRPLKMWAVNTESIRIFPSWTEATPDYPRYAQMTGLKGERGAILFYDDELLYIRDNIATDTPFGTGKMEIGFRCVSDFLGVQEMSGRSGSDQVHKTWLWWEQPQSEAAYQIVRRHIQNELEGQAKISIIGGMKKPEVIEVQPTLEQDLLLGWQEMLIRMIGNSFDLSAMALGIEHDVNRATGEVLDQRDHRAAVVPMAHKLEEAFTTRILHKKLKWYDLEFRFLNLDDPDVQTKMDILARMYSANAETPNGIRKEMGKPPLNSPFADLTQFETMLVNLQASAMIQQQQADQAHQQQMDMMDQQNQLMAPEEQDWGYGSGEGDTMVPEGPGQPGQPASNGLSLPKFPISGSRYTAREIASMPISALHDLFELGAMPPAEDVLRDMEQQEPGIIQELDEQIRALFEYRIEKEAKNKKIKPVRQKFLRQWMKDQQIKLKHSEGRTGDFSEWLRTRGQSLPQPDRSSNGRSRVKTSPAGTPGKINPALKQ